MFSYLLTNSIIICIKCIFLNILYHEWYQLNGRNRKVQMFSEQYHVNILNKKRIRKITSKTCLLSANQYLKYQ